MGSVKHWMLKWRMGRSARQTRIPQATTTKFRNHLGLGSPDSRRALTRLIFSDHKLGIEILRKSDGEHRPRVPREWRLCRFCVAKVEDEVHAIFDCKAKPELVQARGLFWSQIQEKGEVLTRRLDDLPPQDRLMSILENDTLTGILGRYVASVFTIYDTCPEWVPARALYDGSAEVGVFRTDVMEEDDEVASDDEDYYLVRGYG